tara:strand:- start:29793 stop:30683 length:891 start_codon:yes stop_codon:yes gene_type:complete
LKVLVLVANSNSYPSNIILPFIKKTWAQDERIKTIFYQGDGENDSLHGDTLLLNVSSKQEFVNEKGLKAFKWVIDNIEFDVLFRCTTTTYLDIENMINFLGKQKLDNFFCGPVDVYPWYEVPEEEKITFVSGAGCFFSRDVIEKLIENKDQYDFSLNDDVAISELLVNKLKIPITQGYRQDFYNGYPFFNEIDLNNYHFRFKLSPNFYPRYLEILTLLSIHFRKSLNNNLLVLIVDFMLYLIFKFLRFLNPKFIYYKSRIFIMKIKKYTINIIKRIPLIYKFFELVKKSKQKKIVN